MFSQIGEGEDDTEDEQHDKREPDLRARAHWEDGGVAGGTVEKCAILEENWRVRLKDEPALGAVRERLVSRVEGVVPVCESGQIVLDS